MPENSTVLPLKVVMDKCSDARGERGGGTPKDAPPSPTLLPRPPGGGGAAQGVGGGGRIASQPRRPPQPGGACPCLPWGSCTGRGTWLVTSSPSPCHTGSLLAQSLAAVRQGKPALEEPKSFVTSVCIHHPKIKFCCLLRLQCLAQGKP